MIRSLLASLVLLCPTALNGQEGAASADAALPSIVAPAHVEPDECERRVMVVYVLVVVRAGPGDDWLLATMPPAHPEVGPVLFGPTRELGEEIE